MSRERRSKAGTSTWPEPVYLDASALVKLFVPEAGSDALNDALVNSGDVIISDLALTEMASALGRRVREGHLPPEEARRLQREAEKLVTACHRLELTPLIHRRAERLLLASGDVSWRALDALHIASALDADAATVVTFDSRLAGAAATQGLYVAPDVSPNG